MTVYSDKNGTMVKEGDFIRYDGEDEIHKVYACGDDELGINASNIKFLRNHPNIAHQEFYPIPEHGLSYEVVHPTEEEINKLKEEMGEYF